MRSRLRWTFLLALLLLPTPQGNAAQRPESWSYDDLSALWSYYKHVEIQNGRVIERDEGGITTSEAQGYALLQAVWINDPEAFAAIWDWTHRNLAVRGDRLFAWKWHGRVLDRHSATDADTDIALALVLAARRFEKPAYLQQARSLLNDIWEKEILHQRGRSYVVAGDWALLDPFPTIHTAYLAPYAYAQFAAVDPAHPWQRLIRSSYALLHWLYFKKRVALPPEILYVNKNDGTLQLENPRTGAISVFSYDAFPIFWRLTLDEDWCGRYQGRLRRRMLAFFENEWRRRGLLYDRYTLAGEPLSQMEGLPLYATVHALAALHDQTLARTLEAMKLGTLRGNALVGRGTPYYLHNWLWFDLALKLKVTRNYNEFMGFLLPFDFQGFSEHFPYVWFILALLFGLSAPRSRELRILFLVLSFGLCLRYLHWRLFHSLNFLERAGPVISLSLWLAEFYSFSTVALLLIQVGLGSTRKHPAPPATDYAPSVDVLIPIYTEPCEILERTLTAVCAMDYPRKKVYVLDDSHREAVKALAEEFGATYLPGPRRFAKAGNLNNALPRSDGELVAVFDTDHMPVASFLKETVPYFSDPRIGFVQTPHHFFNADIFQRAFQTGNRIPNEQDLFNHAIQGGRDSWEGAFFVGSGAVFRRQAIMSVHGFNLMSVTEDIHTSQDLHAAGWTSVFVNKDLAAGLTAENLASYLVQRKRWMLGCLQIFFKDNPLFRGGLGWRHRLGYFASLYYFFFPLARVVYWATPLYYLLFHWHPMLADLSVLLAYLVPMMVLLPLISSTLLAGWPRAGWGVLYETVAGFPLLLSMAELLLPRSLPFRVTPKGLTSNRRVFDKASALATLTATVITIIAITKGLVECYYFGIEKDAYFFNLAWAFYNLLFLGAALAVAWEKPQRRGEERLKRTLPVAFREESFAWEGLTRDISLSGISWTMNRDIELPETMELRLTGSPPLTLKARRVYTARTATGAYQAAYAFAAVSPEERRQLVSIIFSTPDAWAGAHDDRARSNLQMLGELLRGCVRYFQPLKPLPNPSPTKQRPASLVFGAVLLAVLAAAPAPASLSENWYLSRGKSNMKIGNYKAAIEAYEKAAEAEPVNREALRGLGLAYEAQGETDKAIAQFDRYLAEVQDDPEIAFKQADYLSWSRYAYRRADAFRYYRMGLAHRDDPAQRLKLADLLMAEKDSRGAIVEYERVLEREPRNAQAHAGLAKAYAWVGENDKALYHSQLALAYQPKTEVHGLERRMKKGREPEVGADLRFYSQPGSGDYSYSGFASTIRGHFDLGPFMTVSAAIGGEDYWHSGDSAGATLLNFGGELRLSRMQRIEMAFGEHALRGRGQNSTYRFQYSYEGDALTFRPGFERALKDDSFLSLAGETVAGQFIGAARSNLFYAELGWKPGLWELSAKPYIGWVSDVSGPNNAELGVDSRVEHTFVRQDAYRLSALYQIQVFHFDKDSSGFTPSAVEPFPGGYYSPRAFVNQTPQLAATWRTSESREWTLRAGPSLQYADERTSRGVWRLGGEGWLSHHYQLSPSLAWTTAAGFTKVGQVYNRYALQTALAYHF